MTTIDIPALRAQADSGTVPAWHKDLLSSRLHRLDSGSEPVSPWREARERIRAQIKKSRRERCSQPKAGCPGRHHSPAR